MSKKGVKKKFLIFFNEIQIILIITYHWENNRVDRVRETLLKVVNGTKNMQIFIF